MARYLADQHTAQTWQARMQAKLATLPFPKKEIHVYGTQIVITCWSRHAAEQWAMTLAKFCTVRGIVDALDEAKVQDKGGCLNRKHVKVCRVFAKI